MADKKIILLASDGNSTRIIYNHLSKSIPFSAVILESPESRKVFIRRRIKKLGAWKVAGQLVFQLFAVNWLRLTSGARVREILSDYRLERRPVPGELVRRIPSVNSDGTLELLRQLQPDLVIVNGTRIISRKILQGLSCPFINTHAGITPMYRGVHGGYWALVNNDRENCGVTVHLVDAGIDTGDLLFQARIHPTGKDNFITYPLLQTAAALELLTRAVTEGLQSRLQPQVASGHSRLWYHPTIGQYVYNRLVKRVK